MRLDAEKVGRVGRKDGAGMGGRQRRRVKGGGVLTIRAVAKGFCPTGMKGEMRGRTGIHCAGGEAEVASREKEPGQR